MEAGPPEPLEHLLRELERGSVYPETSEEGEVEIIQTHLSIVCLVGDRAYKLKKAIRLPFVDFSRLEQRRYYCEEELRLNRRLCPEVYLEVAPLRRTGTGSLRFGGEKEGPGEIIDFAVKMRRLPAEAMMDRRLAAGMVSRETVEAIARRMAAFHRDACRDEETRKFGSPATLRDNALSNFEETRGDVESGLFDSSLHDLLEQRCREDFDRLLPELERRAVEGRVVDGHGDLHSRNICLTSPPAIYDCIEFQPAFRCADVATENAFLVMDLTYRGHPELARAYLDAYIAEDGDEAQRVLMPTLVRYRAMVRAKVDAIGSREAEMEAGEAERLRHGAQKHFHLAAASAVEEVRPVLLVASGLPASGKSTVLKQLAAVAGWPVLSSDRLRKELAGAGETERLPEKYYTPEFSARVYRELNLRAEEALARGPVLLDANFPSRESRAQARTVADKVGAGCAVLAFSLDESEQGERLRQREEEGTGISDAGLDVYRKLKAAYEPPDAALERIQVTEVDGSAQAGASVSHVLRFLMETGWPDR